MNPRLIAHRGNTNDFPENTLEAFLSAFEHGAGGVEFDVQLHRGECSIVHDYLHNMDKAYPLLSDVLEALPNKKLEIEIKAYRPDIVAPFTKILQQRDLSQLEVTTSVQALAPYLRTALPKVKMGIIFQKFAFEPWMTEDFLSDYITGVMSLLGAQVAHIPATILSSKLIDTCHKNGLLVHSHIYKTEMTEQRKELQRFSDLGVDQCTFDDIQLLTLPTLGEL